MKDKISIIVFAYNRPGYLDYTLEKLIQNCSYPRNLIELIISDDGSKNSSVIPYIAAKHSVDKVLLNRHGGLGYNQNMGLRQTNSPFILHLQDDFMLENKEKENESFIDTSIGILKDNGDIDTVRLFDISFSIPYTGVVEDFDYKGTIIKKIKDGIFTYSDNPHIKRKSFHEKFGFYDDHDSSTSGCEMTECNFDINCREKGIRACYLNNFFKHFGTQSVIGHPWKSDETINCDFNPFDDKSECINLSDNLNFAQVIKKTILEKGYHLHIVNKNSVNDIVANNIKSKYLSVLIIDGFKNMHIWIESMYKTGWEYDHGMTNGMIYELKNSTDYDCNKLWSQLGIFRRK